MRRVSSRQRIVSWDSFDATHYELSSDDEDYTTYFAESKEESPSAASRKRERFHKPLDTDEALAATKIAISTVLDTVPAQVPSFSWELPTRQELYLDDLPTDLHVNVLAFLDITSIRAIMGVNHKYRQLLLSTDANSIWMSKCQELWSFLPASEKDTHLVDALNLPTAAGVFARHDVNLPLLISMTPAALPTKVDERLLEACSRTRRRTTFRQRRSEQAMTQPSELAAFSDQATGRRLIRYTGLVGSGDRCLRSNNPLPRPQRRKVCKGGDRYIQADQPSLFELLCRGSVAIRGMTVNHLRPFVSPYLDSDRSLQVSPRMIAYFEVSITSEQNDAAGDDEDQATLQAKRDCVAVGVATASFNCPTRMPGWDSQSFGYHGDDGGIFHASGGMIDKFGPCFGTGDTVGCGIDHIARGIFFTLNGTFLGYAWKQIDAEFLENNLYAVVGIDTNDPVSVNYGDQPFAFDLTNFTRKHENLIASNYKLSVDEPQDDYLPSYPEI